MSSNDFEMTARGAQEPRPNLPPPPKTATSQNDPLVQRPLSSSSSITIREPQEIPKKRNYWPLLAVLVYIALALFSWIALCIMRDRPLRDKTYFKLEYKYYDDDDFRTNEQYIQAAHIMKTFAMVLTVPVTGFVCSVAAMAYVQGGASTSKLSLKQSMAVADRKWTSPYAIVNAGSSPLYIGFAMILLGVLSHILQAALVGQETFRAGSDGTESEVYFWDVLNAARANSARDSLMNEAGRFVMGLQDDLTSRYIQAYETNLWGTCGGTLNMCAYNPDGSIIKGFLDHRIPDIYITPFRSNFSTGVFPKPQFAPRINTAYTVTNIKESDFKQECRNETETGAFYANYAPEVELKYIKGLQVEVCITGNVSKSPWELKRARQDISETLYFSFVQEIHNDRLRDDPNQWYKVVANTTLGYFELPNRMNGYIAGPVLEKDPLTKSTGQLNPVSWKRANDSSSSSGDPSRYGATTFGPLTSLGLALFDSRSWVGTRLENPSLFVQPEGTAPYTNYTICDSRNPFDGYRSARGCRAAGKQDEEHVVRTVHDFLDKFNNKSSRFYNSEMETVSDKFGRALNLTNYNFITGQGRGNTNTWMRQSVTYDEGILTIRPTISRVGVIVTSVFLALHMLGLLLLSVYILTHKLSVTHMGAEMMVKMGAAHAELLNQAENKENWRKYTEIVPTFAEGQDPCQRRPGP